MLKVAITGNIASGKSTVEGFLKEKGFEVLDTDKIAHNLLEEKQIQKQIIEAFSGYDITENGTISRPKLGKIVFDNENLKTKLENILHPQIKEEVGRFFEQEQKRGEKIAFCAVPLLFEAKFKDIFDKIILVYSDDEIRLKRLMERNNLSKDEAKKRLESQISQDEKTSLADFIIYNNKDLASFRELAFKILEKCRFGLF